MYNRGREREREIGNPELPYILAVKCRIASMLYGTCNCIQNVYTLYGTYTMLYSAHTSAGIYSKYFYVHDIFMHYAHSRYGGLLIAKSIKEKNNYTNSIMCTERTKRTYFFIALLCALAMVVRTIMLMSV